MEQRDKQNPLPLRLAQIAGLTLGLGSAVAMAQVQGQAAPAADLPWQHCSGLVQDPQARLACFDTWAARQSAELAPSGALRPTAPAPRRPEPVTNKIEAADAHDCKNPRYSELSRYWELEAGSDCGTFRIRGYRPISLSLVGSDSVNTQPSSTAVDHTLAQALPYLTHETRIQLSVRTKIMQGLLTSDRSSQRDSLWFGYSQQSYWQLFTGDLSRPFRSTDHEPEVSYVYPNDVQLPLGWRWRYTGLSLNHQSNGQGLPLSRSWNRLVLMAGLEHSPQFVLYARVWKRQQEAADADDNPGIEDFIGRSEFSGMWALSSNNTLGVTLRHALRPQANGSFRLEWLHSLSDARVPGLRNSLRLHTQLFSGFGDSLVDYNRRRTVLSLGLSLVDW